ncbi:MAG TPA: DUF1330 domain-containing protein [Acidisphaera sp.]|nr:DUF1330 domain-containing protein [Acidisphaera sp.]
MKRRVSLGLLGLAGIAAGVVAATSLRAQGGQAPAYVVVEVHVNDAAAYNAYLPKAKATFVAAGARYLARGGKIVAVEGTPPERAVLLEFPSLEQAQTFFSSQGWKDLTAARDDSATVREYVVEGLTP